MPDSYAAPQAGHIRTARRYLWWLVTSQRRRVTLGALLGSTWMIGLTVPPYLLSRAIDDGLQPKKYGVLIAWAAAILAVGVLNSLVGVARHRTMTKVRLDAALRTVRAVIGQATRLGAALPGQVTAGEVVTIGIGDVWLISQSLTITGPGFGGLVAYAVVAALLVSISPMLAIVVLAGVPVLAVVVGPLLGRLQKTGMVYREQQGSLAARMVDIIGGLRVLSGLGGKAAYARRYRDESQRLRTEGYRVGSVTSWIQALGVGLPALFVAIVTWLGARLAVEGTISVGQLVAVYGYVAVLAMPVAFFIEGGLDITRALVCAGRVVNFLRLAPESVDRPDALDAPDRPAVLRDPESGVEVRPGRLTALAGARTADLVTIVDRLGRLADTEATWGGIRLDTIAKAQIRDRILVADNEADLFSGTLRDVVTGRFDADDDTIAQALYVALARDIVDGLPDGLDSSITSNGGNLSGGQRQRVRLVRALLADPEVLLAVEPTSALDATTEAAIAARLRTARAGRTTLVTSTSPLVLDRADTVFYLVDGRAVAAGTHPDLLLEQPGYRALVSRGTDDDQLEPGVEPRVGSGAVPRQVRQ